MRQLGHIDLNTSMYIAAAVLEALVARDRTGLGQNIDITMLGAAMAMQGTRFAEHFATGVDPSRSAAPPA